jgi:hypothetical protein
VLAYNDVFLLIAGFAAVGCAWVTFHHFRPRFHALGLARRGGSEAASAMAAVE